MKRRLHICAIIILTGTCLFWREEVQGQESRRIAIPCTRATVIPPEGYTYNRVMNVLVNRKLNAEMGFNETAYLPGKMFMAYALEMQINDFKLVSEKRDVKIGNMKGNQYFFRKKLNLLSEDYLTTVLFMFSDSLNTLSVLFAYPDSLSRSQTALLDTALATVQWDTTRQLSPMTLFNFSLKEAGDLKIQYQDGREIRFTRNGCPLDTVNELPFLRMRMLGKPDKISEEIPLQKYMEYILKDISWTVSINFVLEKNEIDLDGLKALEVVSLGERASDDSTLVIYGLLLLHPDADIAFIGITDIIDKEATVNLFKAITHSFRIKRKIVAKQSECQKLVRDQKYSQAIECFGTELRNDPNNYSASIGLADALRLANKHSEAVSAYSRIIVQNRTMAEAYRGRAKSYLALKQYEEAVNDSYYAADLNSKDVECILECAAVRESYGDFLKAAHEYERAIKLAPDSTRFYLLWANVYERRGDKSDALRLYSLAIVKDSLYGDAYAKRGMLYQNQKQYVLALKDLNQAIKFNSRDSKLYSARGTIRCALGEYSGAIADLNRAKPKGETQWMPNILKARMYSYLNKVPESMKEFNAALAIDSAGSNALLYRGIFRFMRGEFPSSIVDLQKALQQNWSYTARLWYFAADVKVNTPSKALKTLRSYCDRIKKTLSGSEECVYKYLLGDITEEGFFERMLVTDRPYPSAGDIMRQKNKAASDAHFVIGLKNYAFGLKTAAKSEWKKVMECEEIDSFEYEFARAYLSGQWRTN
jgi:tetratricopeptide (TPR) repeat protein